MAFVSVVALSIPPTVAILYYRGMGTSASLRSLFPGVLITVVAIELSVATYLWIAEVPNTCNGRGDFTCVVNGNQGLLGLLALIAGAVGLWISALFRLSDRRRELAEEEREVAQLLQDTLEETIHNLIHVGGAFNDEQELEVLPQFSRHCLTALLDTRIRPRLSLEVARAADAMDRNLDRIENLTWSDAFQQEAPWGLRSYVGRAIRLLMLSYMDHPDWCGRTLDQPGLQDLKAAAEEGHFQHSFYASDAKLDVPELRTLNRPLICWWIDEPLDRRVRVFEQGIRFRDLARDHHH